MLSLFSNTCDLFLRIFEVFNEIKIEIKVINNKIFTKLYIKISKRKRNFIIYHFLVKSQSHERINYSKCESLPDKKSIPIVMKACFS